MTPEEEAAAKVAADKVAADKVAADKVAADKPKTYDEEYVVRLRREKAEAEAEAKKLKDAEDERTRTAAKDKDDQKALADIEKKRADDLQRKLDREQTKNQQRLVKSELRTEALAAGMLDLDDIALIDASKVEFDTDGEPVGIKDLIAAFKKAKPGKFEPTDEAKAAAAKAKADADKAAGRKPLPAQSADKAAPKDAFDMSPEEFERAWQLAGKQ